MAKNERMLLPWVEREVLRCRPVAMRYFRSSSLRVERKADKSPVTMADRRVEERLRQVLARRFKGETILGEEFGRVGGDSSNYWIIDPIDGTRAFTLGLPTWAIMLGRVERGRAVLGVCDFPALGITMSVAPGVRAYERIGQKLCYFPRPRRVRSLSEVMLLHGGLRWWLKTPYARGFMRLLQRCYHERSYGDCYGYLWALRGNVDAVIDYGVKEWDLVPLAALARATGRVLTDFSGRISFTGPEAIFAPPTIARLISKTLKSKR